MTTQNPHLTAAGRHLHRALMLLAPLKRVRPDGHGALHPTELEPLWDELGRVSVSLTSAGVRVEDEKTQGTPPPSPDSLEHLRRIEESRMEGKVLLYWLREILAHAEALDRARGDWAGDMADTERGETPGTNYAEAIQELLLRLQGELGAEGSGRE